MSKLLPVGPPKRALTLPLAVAILVFATILSILIIIVVAAYTPPRGYRPPVYRWCVETSVLLPGQTSSPDGLFGRTFTGPGGCSVQLPTI